MNQAEFDKFADEYASLHAGNIAISGEDPAYFAEYKMRDLAGEYARRGARGAVPDVLDFGAGIGNSIPWLKKYLPEARLTCLDVSARSLEISTHRYGELAQFVCFDGGRLPFADASFDLAYAACVFHHIEHAEHVRLLGELRRVLRPGGMLAVFEHNPYNPLTVRTVRDCAFDDNARLIDAGTMCRRAREAGFSAVHRRYRIFFPRPLKALRGLEKYMTWLALGAQYYALAIR